MKEDKILLVDIDNVLWDLTTPWIKWLDDKYNLTVTTADVKMWDLHSVFPTLTANQLYEPLKMLKFWEGVEPFSDAQEYLPKLQMLKYDVKIVSATGCRTGAIKIPKILEAFPTLVRRDIILCEDKRYVRGKYLIDDNIDYLQEREFPILYNSFHNEFTAVPSYYNRVNNWSEIYDLLKNT